MKEYCEFYPKLDGDTCVCDAGSDVSETTDSDDICSKEYSLTCQWANKLRTDKSAPSSLVTIKAELDPTSTGTSQRYTVGEVGDDISGAIYLSKHIELPCELIIQFSKKGEQNG